MAENKQMNLHVSDMSKFKILNNGFIEEEERFNSNKNEIWQLTKNNRRLQKRIGEICAEVRMLRYSVDSNLNTIKSLQKENIELDRQIVRKRIEEKK